MKYEVGDKVLVREDLSEDRRYYMEDKTASNSVTISMTELKGKVVTIRDCRFGQYQIKECAYNWTDGMFKGRVEELNQTKTQEEKKMTEKEKVAEAKRVRNKKMKELREKLGIERVIVNRNTLVVFFKSGEKVVEKAVGKDEFDIRVGIALAYAHKTAGSKMLFNEVVDKITSKVEVF